MCSPIYELEYGGPSSEPFRIVPQSPQFVDLSTFTFSDGFPPRLRFRIEPHLPFILLNLAPWFQTENLGVAGFRCSLEVGFQMCFGSTGHSVMQNLRFEWI